MAYFEWDEEPGCMRDVTLHVPMDAELLSIGCGTGWLGDRFDRHTGIDGSPAEVAIAAGRGRTIIDGM
jgi:hypothetical protein